MNYYKYDIKIRFIGLLTSVFAYNGLLKVTIPDILNRNFSFISLLASFGGLIFLYITIETLIREPYLDRPVSIDDEKITSYFMKKPIRQIRFEDIRFIKRPVSLRIKSPDKKQNRGNQLVTFIDKHNKKITISNAILYDDWKKREFYDCFAFLDLIEEIESRVDPKLCKIIYQKQKLDGLIRKDIK